LPAVLLCGMTVPNKSEDPHGLPDRTRARTRGKFADHAGYQPHRGEQALTQANHGLLAVDHAQAVVMAGWAPSHGARKDVAILCERIVVAQRDEIAMMQTWLRDRGQAVPDAASTRHRMKMNGVEHDMLMPGMLTDEEMAALDRARGPEFDRLFLVGMIKHHQGAIDMVDVLFKAYGAAQDETVFRFASDVYADQSIEIDRMNKMLEAGHP